MSRFKLSSHFKPAGDQPEAILKLVKGLKKGFEQQTLLGITGSGKTFTIANVIEHVQRPTLVIAHNKTLAAQLASEFREFFPENAVEYFVSYYDYYQPEAYLPSSDTYIEKDAQINKEIDKLRHRATAAALARRDVIVVASVSCIYGLGSPESYKNFVLHLLLEDKINRDELVEKLIDMHYTRSNVLERSRFFVQGNVFQIVPPGEEVIYRIELQNFVSKGTNLKSAPTTVKSIAVIDLLTKKPVKNSRDVYIFPAKHFVVENDVIKQAIQKIREELKERLLFFQKEGKLLEIERLERRTLADIEMMQELGYCNGIENYSRHLTDRAAGEPPSALLDYFPEDFLVFIDESHVTIPQLGGMYEGDHSRKQVLIEHGFRLPSALDNRPLKFVEFEKKIGQRIYISATPGKYEQKHANQIVEQIIRPTGLLDPLLEVRPITNQIEDLFLELEKVIQKKERALVTTLTKKQAEDLSDYLEQKHIQVNYLHSDVDTLDRIRTLDSLRRGDIDVLIGVNLLREGLDLPEVSFVAILDADKEGFLRSETSLIQTIGRAARNISGKVILYADHITHSMQRAIDETNRRREKQIQYNIEHHITPKTIQKAIKSIIDHELNPVPTKEFVELEHLEDLPKVIRQKEQEMKEYSKNLQFERAAIVRDEIRELKKIAELKY